MSLCDRVMELSDGLADLLIEADGCAALDEGKSLRLLRQAVDAAHAVKFGNESARAILSAARAEIAQRQPDAPDAANDDHAHSPENPDPIVA